MACKLLHNISIIRQFAGFNSVTIHWKQSVCVPLQHSVQKV